MNIGEQSIQWLYGKQLKVDDEWAIPTTTGFKWWADNHAQTIEILKEEIGPDGNTGYLISVRTEFLRNLDLTDDSLTLINTALTPYASLAGPVYDDESRTLDLCSLVRVHEGNSGWMNPLISLAVAIQIAEVGIMGSAMAETLNVQEAISEHPDNGTRPQPDEIAEVVASLVVPTGNQPSQWTAKEFDDVVEKYMQGPPSILATAGGVGCTVEFPYGKHSSLCQIMGDQPHPRYGNGLFLLQSFPVGQMSDTEGTQLALSFNAKELAGNSSGYGFGSYTYRDKAIYFTSFWPNLMYKAGLLPNLYFACAWRAKEMSILLTGSDWKDDSFKLNRSPMGRLFDRFRGR